MEHCNVVRLIDSRYRTNVSRYADIHLDVSATIKLQELRDLDGFAGVADKKMIAGSNRSLMNAQNSKLAFEWIDVDHDHMGDDMQVRIRRDGYFLGAVTLTFIEERRVTLGRIGHQALEYIE